MCFTVSHNSPSRCFEWFSCCTLYVICDYFVSVECVVNNYLHILYYVSKWGQLFDTFMLTHYKYREIYTSSSVSTVSKEVKTKLCVPNNVTFSLWTSDDIAQIDVNFQ